MCFRICVQYLNGSGKRTGSHNCEVRVCCEQQPDEAKWLCFGGPTLQPAGSQQGQKATPFV